MDTPLSDADADALLAAQSFGHLGCADAGKPYVFPMGYAYHEGVIYGQTTEGRKVGILRANPSVCFQVQDVAEGEWQSVLCWGAFEELDVARLRDPDSVEAVRLLHERLATVQEVVGVHVPLPDEQAPAAGRAATIFRIVVREKTGRHHRPG